MVIKEPENEEDIAIVEEIERKSANRDKLAIEEMQFAVKHPEYFIDSEELAKINIKTDESILKRISARCKNYKAWTR